LLLGLALLVGLVCIGFVVKEGAEACEVGVTPLLARGDARTLNLLLRQFDVVVFGPLFILVERHCGVFALYVIGFIAAGRAEFSRFFVYI